MCYGRGRVYKYNVMKRTQNVTPALLAFRTNQKSGGSGHGLQSPLLIGITRITSRLRCIKNVIAVSQQITGQVPASRYR